MKNIPIFILALLCAASAQAQDQGRQTTVRTQELPEFHSRSHVKQARVWFDFQAIQHIGLNNWTGQGFVDDLLPPTSMTELRGSFNFAMSRRIGFFVDMGVGIMPAPRKSAPDISSFPLPTSGARYFIKEEIASDIIDKATANFKMTTGVFARFTSGKLSVKPYAGVGYMVVRAPSYEAVIKEEGTNMQYIANLLWMAPEDYGTATLGYVTGRLNFSYPLSTRTSITLGLEYTHVFTRPEFSATYTNSFNRNIVKLYQTQGNRVNMLGVSLGFSFM